MKNCDIFLIFAENIDRVYTLEAPLWSTYDLCIKAKIKENMYTPINPRFAIKVGCRGVTLIRTCYPDLTSIR